MRVIACPINTHFLLLSSFWHEVQKRVQPTILRPNLTFHNPHGQWIGCTPIMFTILLLSRSQMSTAFGGSCCLRGGESIFFFSILEFMTSVWVSRVQTTPLYHSCWWHLASPSSKCQSAVHVWVQAILLSASYTAVLWNRWTPFLSNVRWREVH